VKAIVLASGGMDSTTLLYEVAGELGVDEVHALGINYGQRHNRELAAAANIAEQLNVQYDVVDLTSLARFLRGSALSDPGVDVPLGHYAEDTMRQTIVPNRNAIMLNVAVGVAIGEGAENVYTAVHAGDHPVYPDCRPEFIDAMNELVPIATESDVLVVAPYVFISKADIASIGWNLGVPFERTWSCYEGGAVHCGRCGTCTERIEAFAVAGVPDATEYADRSAYEELKAQGRVEG